MKFIFQPLILLALVAGPFLTGSSVLEAGESSEALADKPFLGVEVGSVSRALRYHLDLEDEVGLSVNYVVPGSSAAMAGLKEYDILVYFNDQLIVNNSQFSALLRRSSPGDPFALRVLRKAKEMQLNGNMGSRLDQMRAKEDNNAAMPRSVPGVDMDEIMATAAEAYEDAMAAISEVTVEMRENEEWREHLRRAQDAIRERVKNIQVGRPPQAPQAPSPVSNIVLKNDEGTLILKNEGGSMLLTAIDNEGRLLYSGPLDTEEDRMRVPPEVMKRLEKVEVIEVDESGNFEVKDVEVIVPEVDSDISYLSPPATPAAPVPPSPVTPRERESEKI